MKIYKQIRTLFDQDAFVIHSTLSFVLMMMIVMVMGTYLIKQQGLLLPMAFISGLALAESISGMVLVYFKTSFVRSAQLFITIRVFAFVLLVLLFTNLISTEVWVYVLAITGVIKGLIDSTFGINYDDHLRKTFCSEYEEQYKDIQYTERTIFSTARTIWGTIMLGLYGLVDSGRIDIDTIMVVALIMGILSLTMQVHIYINYWSKVK